MKDVDDTPVPESESEDPLAEIRRRIETWNAQIREMEKRVANLEARKPPQDTNPDPEWYA